MNIFKMEIRQGLKSLSIWSIVCILLIILFMSMFPSMKDSGMQELVDTKLGAMPPALLEAFNLADAPDFSKLNEYFAYVFQYIAIAGCIYASQFLIGSVFLCVGFFISVVIKHLRLAMPLSIGLFFVTYLLGIFSGMIDPLKF